MKKSNFFHVFVLGALFASVVEAGPRVGNGGGAWVCQDKATKDIRWIRLVDLFEAENEYGLQVPDRGDIYHWNLFQEKMQFIRREIPELSAMLKNAEKNLENSIRILPNSACLTQIRDTMIRVFPNPQSCQNGYLYYAQLANYTLETAGQRLLIAGVYWNAEAFSSTDRAALLMHEVIYKALRDQSGDRNSSRARAMVAFLFSDLPGKTVDAEITRLLSLPPSLEEGDQGLPRKGQSAGSCALPE